MSPPLPRHDPQADGNLPDGNHHRLFGFGHDHTLTPASPTFSDSAHPPDKAHGSSPPHFPSDLSAESLIHREQPSPQGGWRRTLFALTRGHINPGDSKTSLRRKSLEAAVRSGAVPRTRHTVAVLGTERGVGASTTALGLGALLAHQRGDRVVAVDADVEENPLSDRVRGQTQPRQPLENLLRDPDPVSRYSQISEFVVQDPSGLDVLPSNPDDTGNEPLNDRSYRRIADAVERFYSLLIADAGTAHLPAIPEILERSDQLVLVTHPSHHGANRAATALEDIADLGFGDLAAAAVVVLARAPSGHRPGLDDLEEQLSRRCRKALRVTSDGALGSKYVTLPQLGTKTMLGYLELAAEITRAFDNRA